MTTTRCLLLPCLLAGAALPAQDQATTLLAAVRAAEVVVIARVTAATDPSPEWHRLAFQATAVLKGSPPAAFTLLEPAGACCGRSLFALQPGDVRLLFLQRRGPQWHPFGGDRGVLPAEPAIAAHVQALQAAGDPATLARVLCDGLQSAEPRVADDAAHALAALPQLSLSPGDRELVARCLQEALALRTTRCAALVDVAIRVADDAMVDVLLACYLDSPREDQAGLLRSGLRRCGASGVSDRLPMHVRDPQRALRAAQLLVELPTPNARTALAAVLRAAGHPRVQLCVAEALLANGARGHDLAAMVPAPVLELAQRRASRPRPFRAIDPQRR